MQNIHGGNENKGKPGTPAKQPKGKCAFDNGSCCRRTELCDTGSNG